MLNETISEHRRAHQLELEADRVRREDYNHKLVHNAILISVGTWSLVAGLIFLGAWLTMLAIRRCRQKRAAKISKNDDQAKQIDDIKNILGALEARLLEIENE